MQLRLRRFHVYFISLASFKASPATGQKVFRVMPKVKSSARMPKLQPYTSRENAAACLMICSTLPLPAHAPNMLGIASKLVGMAPNMLAAAVKQSQVGIIQGQGARCITLPRRVSTISVHYNNSSIVSWLNTRTLGQLVRSSLTLAEWCTMDTEPEMLHSWKAASQHGVYLTFKPYLFHARNSTIPECMH